jgi:acyl-CoA thioester hydrolase
MGLIKTRMLEVTGVRINWDYKIVSLDNQELCVTAQVSLVALDRERGKIMRQLPATFQEVIAKIAASYK